MGIISLHSFLNHSQIRSKNHLYQLKNKKICIDIYNYIYKYLSRGKLIPQLEKMCKVFRKHNIQCLFVFDGKYDKIKIETQNNRKIKREKAEVKFQKLSEKEHLSNREKKLLHKLKRERVKVTKWDIYDTKKCLELCGMKYVVASGEAEEYCAALVSKKYVFACVSDDTDLFPYGCKYVIRNLNINKETFEMYYLPDVLNYIGASLSEFKIICCLSSNDYNLSYKKKHFIYYKNLFDKYLTDRENNNELLFIDWLDGNDLLSKEELEKFDFIKEIYDIQKKNTLKNTKYVIIRNGVFNQRGVNILSIDRENYLAELYQK